MRDSKIRITCNVLATPRRFYLALGGTPKNQMNITLKNIHTGLLSSQHSIGSCKDTRRRTFEENSSRNLYDLPIVTHFEKDAGPFITSSIVFSENQEKGKQNQSTHRLLRLDDRHMAIRMVESRHLHKCFTYARDHGEDLKVAIAIGVSGCKYCGVSGSIWCRRDANSQLAP